MNKKATLEQLIYWLGTDDQLDEAMETLLALANGEYKPEVFKRDILETNCQREKEIKALKKPSLKFKAGEMVRVVKDVDHIKNTYYPIVGKVCEIESTRYLDYSEQPTIYNYQIRDDSGYLINCCEEELEKIK